MNISVSYCVIPVRMAMIYVILMTHNSMNSFIRDCDRGHNLGSRALIMSLGIWIRWCTITWILCHIFSILISNNHSTLLWYLLVFENPIGHEHCKVLLFTNPSIHTQNLLTLQHWIPNPFCSDNTRYPLIVVSVSRYDCWFTSLLIHRLALIYYILSSLMRG